jgi:PAS domain S-box-containing protein
LARGTRAVAKGDFSQMPQVKSRDELGVLIQSFNRMTRQLSEAREQVARNHQQTEQAKAFLERVLANLSSGVMVLDEALQVRNLNGAAAQILGVAASALDAQPLAGLGLPGEALHEFAMRAAARFAEHEGEWQEQIDYAGHGGSQSLLLRGTRLPPGVERGYVLVFDDVTKLINAERNAAWSEVARRLAHEIKVRSPQSSCPPNASRASWMVVSRRRTPSFGARHANHRQPGGRDEEYGRRVCRLCADAARQARGARPQCTGGRGAGAVRCPGARAEA